MRSRVMLTTCLLLAGVDLQLQAKPPNEQANKINAAKVVAESFMKAIKEKDASAAAKVADVPFLFPNIKAEQPQLDKLEKAEALATGIKAAIQEWPDPPTAIGEVQSLADFNKAIGDGPEKDHPMMKDILDIGGDNGFMVFFVNDKKEKAGCLLIRVKDDSAKVVGIMPMAAPASTKEK